MGHGKRANGGAACKVCNHPGKTEIDAMLLNGAPYRNIQERMRYAHPEQPALTNPNLSRHKKAHLLTRPIKVTDEDGAEGYLIGHLSPAPVVPRESLPSEMVPVPAALKVVINLGVRNIMQNPELVSPQILIAALEMARKLGIGGQDDDDFRDAWKELSTQKRRRRRKVTVEEEEVGGERPTTACRSCGLPTPKDGKFCVECGSQLVYESPTQQVDARGWPQLPEGDEAVDE